MSKILFWDVDTQKDFILPRHQAQEEIFQKWKARGVKLVKTNNLENALTPNI